MWLLTVFLPLMRVYLCGIKVLIYQLLNRSFTLPVLPKLSGRIAIVTGGARGMGLETARHLAGLGMHVVIAGNDETEGLAAVEKIHEEAKEGKAEFMFLDLASLKSVRQFVHRFKVRGLPLHTLVNNAGIMLVPEMETEDGFEFHFGLNYLGHFLLTNLLLDTLVRSGTRQRCARVVTMASATHYGGTLDLDNLHSRRSKVALVMFTKRLQDRMAARGLHVTANNVDPGMVDTALYDFLCGAAKMAKRPFTGLFFRVRALRRRLIAAIVFSDSSIINHLVWRTPSQGARVQSDVLKSLTPAEGASTAIYAAAAAELEGVGGRYLYNGEDRPSAGCTYDVDLQEALWRTSCALTGLQEA
ncbi:Dehydrogenase/reductase SDR family member on chromosome X [Merluccius polli]|uniref:Dehydrogenase/reductase SDR family member on chromosome X n=1 Tax=Merluccius polli TaxID=89951 RepID=A0AA47P9W5_MERPO|nr:Dehydrogenase/reductase SDR family member on chromosome X [Merluccius polli]